MVKRNRNNILFILFLMLVCVLLFYICYYCKIHHNTRESLININDDELKEFSFGKKNTSKIPNIIWTFWEGDNHIVVDMCIESWKYYNPEYDIRILNKSNYSKYTDIDIDKIHHSNDFTARFSDYVRCLVLSKYGGFWIDASIICHHPFSWVHGIQSKTNVEYVGYYIDKTPTHEKTQSPVIENWFFACIPNSTFVNDWCKEFLSTRNFKTINDYLDDVKSQDVDIDNVEIPEYLTMHVSAQKILQKNLDKYSIYVFSACSGPFKYLCETGFNDEEAVKNLLDTEKHKKYYKYTFVKICGGQRKILEKYDRETLQSAFSNLE